MNNSTKGNGPTAINNRPVKSLKKRTADFIQKHPQLVTFWAICLMTVFFPSQAVDLVLVAGMVTPKQFSLLPEEPFMPLMPPANSAAATALNDLLERDITQLDWLADGKGWRLSAAIKQLDYLGWEPQSIMVKCNGWGRAIARYSLSAKAKQAAAVMRQKGNP